VSETKKNNDIRVEIYPEVKIIFYRPLMDAATPLKPKLA